MEITRRQFIEAQKVVENYRKQLLKGQYHFLYYFDKTLEPETKSFKAKNIMDACKKMRDFIESKSGSDNVIIAVDYEVQFGDRYIDISDNEILNDFV